MTMRIETRTATFAAAAGTFLAIFFWIGTFYGHPWSDVPSDWSDFGGYIGGVLAPILAFASFLGLLASLSEHRDRAAREEERKDAEVHLQSATSALERAYNSIMAGGEGVTPNSDRLAWLTSARLILMAEDISSRIGVESIREMYLAEEEYWRRRFYEVFDPAGFDSPLNDPAFYRRGEERVRGYFIDERSIKVIFRFCDWPEGREDPIDSIARFTDAELERMTLGRRGAAEFIRAKRRGDV